MTAYAHAERGVWLASGLSRVLKNAGWLSLGQLAQTLGGAFLLIYLTRRLGPELFGAWQFCLAIGSYAVLAGTLGIGGYGTWLAARDPLRARPLAERLMRVQTLLSLVVFVGLSLSAMLIHFSSIPRSLLILTVAAALVRALWPDWLLKGLQRGRALAINDTVLTVATVALLMMVVRGPRDSVRVPLSQLALSVCLAPVVWWLALRGSETAPDSMEAVSSVGKLLHAAVPLGLAAVMVQVYYNMDYVLLGLLRTKVETAFYAAGYQIILALLAFGAAVHSASYPYLTEALAHGQPLAGFVRQLNRLLLLAVAPVAVGGAIVAQPLVLLLFGSQYDDTATSFRLLLWILPVVFVGSTYGDVILARGLRSIYARVVTIGAAVNLGLNLLLIPHYGTLGAAAATLLTEITVACLCVWIAGMGVQLDLRYGAVTILATILMSFTLFWIASAPVLIRIGIAGGVYFAAATVLITILNRPWSKENKLYV